MVIRHDSHISSWWFESQDGPNFFFPDFLLSFFRIFAFKHYIFIIAEILKMILWLYKLFTSLHMHIHLHYYFFCENCELFQEIRPTVGKPCPLYILLWFQEANGLDLYKSHWIHTLPEIPKNSVVPNSQMNIVCNVLHQNIFWGTVSQKRSFHMLFQFRVTPLTPLILKVTSQNDEMPDSTVRRAARTSSVNNLKTISEVGYNLTYLGSFVSPSNTYDQRLKKVPFELPKKLERVIKYQVRAS